MLVDGEWDPTASFSTDEEGRFVRQETEFRDQISADPNDVFSVEPGRYHLNVSLACPWAHRTLIGRSILGLEEFISVDVVDPVRIDDGWEFAPETDGCTPDTVNGTSYLRDVYREADPSFTGRVTVPVLWDKHNDTIVNNESIEILRMFDTAFVEALDRNVTLYPASLADEIDSIIEAIYDPINNGVYQAGFAESQAVYEEAVETLFEALDRWDAHLADNRYLVGERLTEADICLFTTLIRFDPVYYIHFKCSRRRIMDYPHLWEYLKELYQLPAIKQTVDLDHIRTHYFASHGDINPKRFVAVEPDMPLEEPHDRDQLSGAPPSGALTE